MGLSNSEKVVHFLCPLSHHFSFFLLGTNGRWQLFEIGRDRKKEKQKQTTNKRNENSFFYDF